MFAFAFNCFLPLILAPLCYLEHRGIRYLRENMGYRGFPYVMASLLIYLAPVAAVAMLGGIIIWLTLDGKWVWLGETSYLDPRTEWASGLFFLLLATWPLAIGYLGVGLVVWLLNLRAGLERSSGSGSWRDSMELE
jgi:hypothetical protein